MIPSVLARQLQGGVEDFLRTTFPISTPHFHGVIDRLLEEQGGIFRGPYVSAQLPFRKGTGQGEHFPNVPLGWRPFLHQEQAFQRLGGDTPRSTLVATGTGSGKTESFLVPILDYCYRNRERPGIKAILIYPMNALANDQAGRIARMVEGNDRLRGTVRAGLYVGQKESSPRREMDGQGVITDRDTLRAHPPDILLTNYKMLDYLLVRPDDFPIWQGNDGETLKFMVVDELHTFDGAQGTDLACLIRRLRARLRTPEAHLCYVGTSATLGGREAEAALLDYASQIFGTGFERGSIITESRQTESEFLEGSYIKSLALPNPDVAEALDPSRYPDQTSYLKAQARLWFGDEVDPSSWEDPAWRVGLGEQLKSHPFFRNVLTVLKGKVRSLERLERALLQATPELQQGVPEYRRALFDSFLAIVAAARTWAPESDERRKVREERSEAPPTRPFVELRLQLWLRELRRMVASVGPGPRLAFHDDLPADLQREHLPVVHCRDCGATGWGATRRQMDTTLDPDLRRFYEAFFSAHPNLVFVFPGEPGGPGGPGGRWQWLAPGLRLETATPEEGGIQVFLPENTVQGNQGGVFASKDCPFCESHNGLTILGSRAASLTSVLITQLYASPHNDDKKLIAFSDSVQDASHRAAFFGARTYRFNVRSAIQQFVDQAGEGMTLSALPAALSQHYRDAWSDEGYVAAFLPPDMEWLEEYERMLETGRIPDDASLVQLVDRRVEWEIVSEFGHRARIGRTLEKSGGAIAALDPTRLEAATRRLLHVIPNELGELRALDDLGRTQPFEVVGLVAAAGGGDDVMTEFAE